MDHGARQNMEETASVPSDLTATGDRPPLTAPTLTTLVQALAVHSPSIAISRTMNEQDQNDVTTPSTGATTTRRRFPRGLRRLRDRLQSQEDRLRLDVNALKQDIIDSNNQRLVLNTRQAVQRRLLQQKSVEVVVEYFGAFQRGWIEEGSVGMDDTNEQRRDVESTSHHALTMIRSPRQPSEQVAFQKQRQSLLMDRQRHFIATALDPTMSFGPNRGGVDAFALEWKTYSEHHHQTRLTLTYMTCHGSADEPIVIALGTYSGMLTHQALVEKYPHALSDPRFVKKLVGSTIRYPSREIFHFNNMGLVTRYDRGLDYVRAFASLLDTLDDVAIVLTDAKVWNQEDVTDDEDPDEREAMASHEATQIDGNADNSNNQQASGQ